MDPLVLMVLIATFGVATLVFVTMLVAARADHQVTIRGPLATLEELDGRIATRRDTLTDLEEDLQKRREALANIAEIQADVDALIRQRDELLAEHNQRDERRAEIAALRKETEETYAQLSEASRDLSEKQADLERVEGELSEARRLVADVGAMTAQHRDLESRLAQLRTEIADLEAVRAQEAALRARVADAEREAASLQGELEARLARKEEADVTARTAEQRLGELRSEHTEMSAKLEADRQEFRRLASDISGQRDRMAELQARAAQLEGRIAELKQAQESATGPAGRGGRDSLGELREPPFVLSDLRKWDERGRETEAEALNRVSGHLRSLGLSYPRRVVHAFHTAMKVNETTQMTVLAGISGTGKSQLPRRYAEGMGIGFLQVPVQPRWDSPQDLMGFYNYIESRFRPTDMARALYHLDAFNGPAESADLQGRMLLILLDEMNLARVEYYFSDFLSRLESRPDRAEADYAAARKDSEIELDVPVSEGAAPPRIFPGYNVLFAGTMNEDESTQSLSDKVVDRANVLRFAAPRSIASIAGQDVFEARQAISRERWQGWLRRVDDLGANRARVEEHVGRIVDLMRGLQRPIGHRLGRAMMAYVANYPQDGHALDVRASLADQVEMRLLPKLRGIEVEPATGALDDLRRYVEEDLGDATLGQAIDDSVDASRLTGQFVWRGVTRE